jgi:hypothetical protein
MREGEAAWGAQIFGYRRTQQIVVPVLALLVPGRLLALAARQSRGLPSSRRTADFLTAQQASPGAYVLVRRASPAEWRRHGDLRVPQPPERLLPSPQAFRSPLPSGLCRAMPPLPGPLRRLRSRSSVQLAPDPRGPFPRRLSGNLLSLPDQPHAPAPRRRHPRQWCSSVSSCHARQVREANPE